jgi:O-antigen ligase
VSFRSAVAVVLKTAGVAVLVIVAVSLVYGHELWTRFVGLSSRVDSGEATSGRTEFWSATLGTMMERPHSFIIGFGWNSYWDISTLGRLPHNQYLTYWFTTGLLGLSAFLLLLWLMLRAALRSGSNASPPIGLHLAGFVAGLLALAGAMFFVELFAPWPYVWAYAGLAMCMANASSVRAGSEPAVAEEDRRYL